MSQFSNAANPVKVTPDFAFPEKVEKDASVALDKAMTASDPVGALRAAIQIIAARNGVSGDSFNKNVELLDSLSQKLGVPYSNLSYLLMAKMYTQLYEVSPWQYNSRVLPLDSYPDDPEAWSGDLFAKKVLALVDKAVADTNSAKTLPISEIQPLLVNYKYAEQANLSVYDFIVTNGASLLGTFGRSESEAVIPFFGSEDNVTEDSLNNSENVRSDCALRQRQLTDDLYDWRITIDNVPAKVWAISVKGATIEPSQTRAEFIKKWLDSLSGYPSSGLLLNDYFNLTENYGMMTSDHKKMLFGMLNDYLKTFPDSEYASVIKYDLANLTAKEASLELPGITLSATPVKGKLRASNINTVYLLLYKVPESIVPMNSLNMKEFPGKAKFIKSVRLDVGGTVPFSAEREFELPGLTPGYYVTIPSATPKLSTNWRNEVDRWSINVINVSDISVLTSVNNREKGSGKVYVVSASSQKPLAGAKVVFYSDNGAKKQVASGITDKEGKVSAPEGYYRMRASYGNNVVWKMSDLYYNEWRETEQKGARILTDLSIYKPGETVQYSVIAWTKKGRENTLLKNSPLKIIFRDANWNEVACDSLFTDNFGRSNGSFEVPKQGLLGRYTITVSTAGDDTYGEFGHQGIEVAEYKSPTFFLSLTDNDGKVYEPGESLKFTGEVKTYSGMSLGDLEISYNVRWNQWWRWAHGGIDNAVYNGKVKVDSNGMFEIELPTSNLKGTVFEHGIFILTATATSPAGETQTSAPIRFALGQGFSISPEFNADMIKVTGDSIKLNVPVYDILSHPAIKDVDYSMENNDTGETVLKGSFKSPQLILSSPDISSGSYKFKFNLPGDTLTTDASVIFWRESDRIPPVETPLWVPEKDIIVPDGSDSVNIPLGSSYKGSWIFCQVSEGDRISRAEWVPVNGENISLKVEMPSGGGVAKVSLAGMHDHQGKMVTVTLTPEAVTRKMTVNKVSFRDKITAGDKEHWSFTFKYADTPQPGLPAMAVMSNKSLDAIAPFSWNFYLSSVTWPDYSSLTIMNVYNRSVSANFSVMPKYKQPDLSMPQWETYNQLLAGQQYGGTMIRGMRKMEMSRSTGVVMEDGVENEIFASADSAPALEMAVAESKVMMKMSMKEEAVTVTEEQEDMAADNGSASNGGSADSEKVELREVEMPLAFFMPSLNADEEGNVNVEFTVPNFNTTWKFQIMGYNENLKSAGMVLEAVASKPVMVQMNPPRYLRTGDKATVTAMLYNNTSDTRKLHGEIEVFNPLTGETITSYHLGADDTPAGGNRVIAIDFLTPSDLSAIGLRAYAYGDNQADGEQVLVPVLPSSTPVIESTQFYVGQNQESFIQKLPKFRKDASLTLKYCSNPLWECLLALPSINKPDSKNILSISRAFYANGMAKGIINKYPSVGAGLTKVFEAKKDGEVTALKSNLQKDSLLKTVALINTPWVNNASAETMRMENLSELLDAKRLDTSVADLLKQLSDLQNPDGGWSWCEGMRSSEYITTRVLENLAALNRYDSSSEIQTMARKAISYCDKELYNSYERNQRQFSTVTMLRYLYVRNMFDKGNGKAGFAGLKGEALKAINADWKSFSIYDKATAAILLIGSAGYEKTAPVILESLKQLASKSEAKGWWYDNLGSGYDGMPKLNTTARALEAFSEIEPKSEAVEGLRQWLLLRKETEDWGSNPYTAGIISAILNSGINVSDDNESPVITIDGKPLDTTGAEMLTGILTIQLDPAKVSGKTIHVEKGESYPAWGGVISQYIAPMKEVKAESSANLKIEKQLLLIEDAISGDMAKDIKLNGKQYLKPGDKVRVTLTITCDKDMDYVAVIDERSACLEPVDQISGYSFTDGLGAYKEVRDTKTSFFIGFLPKGVNVISYDCYVDREGCYAVGIATAQSQYSPLQSAHSAGGMINVAK